MFFALILLTFLLVPLMVIGLNPATAANNRGGGGGSGGGKGGGKGGGNGGGGGPNVHDCGGDPNCGGQVTVTVTETVEVISRVTLTIPVVYIIPSGPGTPGTVTISFVSPQTPGIAAVMTEYWMLIGLLAAIGGVLYLTRSCATGQHFPHLKLPTKAVKGESSDKGHESVDGITTPANPTTGGLVAALLGLASTVIPSKSGGGASGSASKVKIKDIPITKPVDSADGGPPK